MLIFSHNTNLLYESVKAFIHPQFFKKNKHHGALTLLWVIAFIAPWSQLTAQTTGETHNIQMTAVELANDLLAYKMVRHEIIEPSGDSNDVTYRYSPDASIPGPTLVIAEGDEVNLTIRNGITARPDQQVSVHVHGVHYPITSDGTLKQVNMIGDQGAYPGNSDLEPKQYTYHWQAAPGTAGSWPYHDHNFGTVNGAEHRGLFGMVIVNPASGMVPTNLNHSTRSVALNSITKDYVLYLGDDAFWGMEIDSNSQQQTPLWVNPTLVAQSGDNVRFHLIAIGTDFHTFQLQRLWRRYGWVFPGFYHRIHSKDIGPLENHAFTIRAQESGRYLDLNTSNKLMGMRGKLKVSDSGGSSIPGPSPL